MYIHARKILPGMFKVLHENWACVICICCGQRRKTENASMPQPISAPVMASVAKAQLLSPNTLHHLNLPELRSALPAVDT